MKPVAPVSAISGLLLVPVRLTTVQPQAISSVIAGLGTASRVNPTCGTLLMCGPRASPRSDAIHPAAQEERSRKDMVHPNSGVPEFGTLRAQVEYARLAGSSPRVTL